MLHPGDRRALRRLAVAIDERRQTCLGQLADGAAGDFADYRARCAYLRALADVDVMCQEIIDSDDPDDPRTS